MVAAAALSPLLLAGSGVGGIAVANNWDFPPIAAWLGGGGSDEDGPSGDGAGVDADHAAATAPGEPSEDSSGEPSEGEEGAEGEGGADGAKGGGSGGDGAPTTTMATVGAGVSASGSRPSGSHVVAFQPADGSGGYAVLDGAAVVCAWSFCQGRGGAVSDGEAGSVPSSPSALTGYVNTGNRTISAEVTYTEGADGTLTITRLVEHHRASGTGTPPW